MTKRRLLQSVFNNEVIYRETFTTEHDLLFAVCELIAKPKKIKLIRPILSTDSSNLIDSIHQIAAAADIRVRKVLLKNKWWQKDSGALLGFYQGNPCALLSKRQGGYKLVDLKHGKTLKVNERIARQLAVEAYYFYIPLPVQVHSIKDLFNFAFSFLKRDFWFFLGVEALINLFALVVPISMGYLFSTVVPHADVLLLDQIVFILLMNTVIITLYNIAQDAALIRFRFKLESIIQPAIWDRVLKFSTQFFRRFSAGDLAFRAGIIKEIQDSLTRSSLISIVNGAMSIIILALLFYYNVLLALAALSLAFIVVVTVIIINYYQLVHMRRLYYHFGNFINIVFEILTGMLKIRITNVQKRVFDLWIEQLAHRNHAEFRVKNYLGWIETFISVMMVINPLILFSLVYLLQEHITFGSFIAFNAAYSLFFINILQMNTNISEAIQTIPLCERAKPILLAKVEREASHSDSGILTGDIEVRHIVFRYHESDKPIFKDFSLQVNPGEFVALVGPSGTGKSTLFRLLLGFEQPEAGGVYYNGMNLKTLKLSVVRKQIGVVIQNSALVPGTILDNIIGSSTQLTRRDAWEIVEKVNLSTLIKSLPMQMDTLVTEGAITLSGGEVQRLILARALVLKPKIIFLDEATSNLDNTTQAEIHSYLRQLNSTQIIAAHRLSTIVNADKIYVMDKGSIVQSGTYQSLMEQPGLFSELAKRQLR